MKWIEPAIWLAAVLFGATILGLSVYHTRGMECSKSVTKEGLMPMAGISFIRTTRTECIEYRRTPTKDSQ